MPTPALERWISSTRCKTVTTIATAGYGEVRPLSSVGRIFTMTLIVGSVGTLLYAFGVCAMGTEEEPQATTALIQ